MVYQELIGVNNTLICIKRTLIISRCVVALIHELALKWDGSLTHWALRSWAVNVTTFHVTVIHFIHPLRLLHLKLKLSLVLLPSDWVFDTLIVIVEIKFILLFLNPHHELQRVDLTVLRVLFNREPSEGFVAATLKETWWHNTPHRLIIHSVILLHRKVA
jgi:hypothetical protein